MDSQKQLKEPNLILGLVIAPALAPVSFVSFLFALVVIDSAVDIGIRPLGIISWTFLALTFGFPVSYGVAWIIGYPYALWLQKTGRLKFRNVVAPIVVLAALLSLLGVPALLDEPTLVNCFSWLLCVMTATGPLILSAGCFWLLSVRRRSAPVIE